MLQENKNTIQKAKLSKLLLPYCLITIHNTPRKWIEFLLTFPEPILMNTLLILRKNKQGNNQLTSQFLYAVENTYNSKHNNQPTFKVRIRKKGWKKKPKKTT